MTSRIDPFLVLDPYARLLLRRVTAGHDLPALALPRHAGLVRALSALLREPAPAAGDGTARARLLAAAPDLAPHVTLLERCAERLIDVLAGRVPASDVMFPEGSMALVEPIYRGNRWTDHFNRLTAIAVARAVATRHAQDAHATVRVLEVGAGTGGTTAAVLAALDPHAGCVVYDYTDVSPGFVQHGRRVHGMNRPYLQGRLLDLEKPPAAQGFAPASYDVVLGTNVLHATSHIATSLQHVHAVLRPGGLLLLNEITRAGAFATMTFGLLDGWWAFRDGEMRLPDAPLLSVRGWRGALRAAGFNAPAVYGWTDPPDSSFQCLFVAAREAALTAADVSTQMVAPVPTPSRTAAAAAAPVMATVSSPAAPTQAATAAAPAAAPRRDLRPLLTERLAALLGLEPGELASDRPFAEVGVDSIVAPQFVSLLNRELGSTLVPTDMFNHATIDALADHLGTMTLAPAAAEPDAAAPCAESPAAAPPPSAVAGDDIAVIGLACRFPGAADADAFWRNLVAGHCAITDVPPERWNGRRDGITRWGGFLDEYDCFDPEFFNLSWREAEAMSPQQRVFLEQAWHALENAGYGRRALAGQRCGVFVGAAPDGYGMQRNDSLSALGGSLAILSARISYLLDLKGPSVPVDTACSSSAVAVHLACQSILAGDCDMALAGGVSILMTNPRLHAFLDDAGMLSPTGQCHTFDAAADGFVPGEGCGVVVLKRLDRALADRDAVLGVIKASGINQDGRTSGITAPSGPAQTALETAVYRKAGIDPASITLIEAHGTGTQLGDPIEVKALEAAFRGATGRTGFCALGSVKTNIGHALAAAGVAGLIKVLLALRHGTIPASLHYTTDNPEISFAGSPFFVPRQAMPWTAALRLAAVSSFGFSGTNAHFVVGEAPPRPAPVPVPGPALILLSARTEDALEARCTGLLAWLADNRPALADLAFTLSQGRGHYEHRLALLVDSIDDLRAGRGRVWRSKALTLPARDGQDAEMASLLAAAEPDLARIADCYVRGGDGDWSGLAPPTARRLPLPAYPFARLRFATRGLDVDAPVAARLHPMLRENVSTLDGVAYRLDLDEAAPWLRDHRFGGAPVVPAVAYLELARAVGSLAGGRAVAGVADLHLERPLTAGMTARITLRAAGDGAAFAVLGTPDAMVGTGGPSAAFTVPSSQASTGAALPDAAAVDIAGSGSTIPGVMIGAGRPSTTFTVPGAQASAGAGPFDAAGREVVDGRPVPIMTLGAPTPRDAATNQGDTRHAGGRILFAVPTVVPPADSPDVIAQRLPSRFSQAEVYARFAALGFSYGPAFQVIRSLRASSTEALAELVPAVPAEAGMVLDPALLDGAVQAAIGLMMAGGEALSSVVPVSVGQAVFLGPVTGPCFAHVRAMGGDADTRRLEITVTDRTGRVLTALCDLVVRVAAARSATLDCLAYAPVWEAAPVPAADRPAAVLLFDRDETIWRALGGDTILVRPGSAFCRLDRTCFVIDPSSEADYARLLETLRAEALLPPTTWHLWSRSAAAGVEVGEAAPHAMVGAGRSSEASTPSDAEAADGAALSDAAGADGVGGQSTPLRVTVGAGRSSTTFTSLSGEASDGIGLSDAAGAKVVDGRPAPTMTPGGPATPAGVDRPSPASAPPRDPAVAEAADILRHGLRSVMLLAAAFARLSPVDPVRILHVHADPARDAPLHTAVGGFAAAVRRENPLLRVRSVGVPAMAPERLIACLSAASGQGEEAEHWAADGTRLVRRLVAVNLPPPVGLRPGGVFLLTGAMGGIGRLLALHLARRCRARLLLVGRSPPDASVDALIAAIRAAGGEAACHAADVSDPAQASAAAAAARARFGALHGVIHAAGVTRDRFLLHKTAADIDAVLAPKIAGTLALDRATAQDDLDVFICFSSLAGSLGNAGQSDYSAANRFLDAFMATRTGPGRSLSIGWPYWTAGGLHVDAEEQARRTAATGIRSLETEQGLALFDALAGSARGAVLLLPGKADALSSLVIEAAATSDRPRPGDAAPDHDAVAAAVAYLRGLLADATAMPADRINPDRPLEQYGIDSILVTRMNAALERDFPAVPKTLFFEHQTLRSAAAYLAARHAAALPASSIATGVPAPRETVPASAPHPLPCHEAPRVVTDATAPAGVPVPAETMPTARHAHPAASPAHRPVVTGPVPPRTDGIAIIGIAGRYPGAGTLEAFWDNLCADRDLITDIPPERWNHAAWFDARPGTPGRSYSKWGGFLDGVDLFDPLFFNIAPAEAAGIDPNERLFLETCWEALENAGHTRATLSRDARSASMQVSCTASTRCSPPWRRPPARAGSAAPRPTGRSRTAFPTISTCTGPAWRWIRRARLR